MPRIIINNLGPVNNCDLDLAEFCVLTGPQASGKSTIAKAIFFFRTIKDDCVSLYAKKQMSGAEDDNFTRTLKKYLRGKFMQMFGSSWGMSMDMSMRYEYDKRTFAEITLKENWYEGTPNYIYIDFSSNIKEFLRGVNRNSLYEKDEVTAMANEIFQDEHEIVYVPAGRSMITLLTSQLNYILSTMDDMQKKSIDYCTQNYMERILRLKPLFSAGIRGMYYEKLSTSTDPVKKELLQLMMRHIDTILKGKYQYMDGEERLVLDEHRYVKLNYTSSGQQEVVWILNLLFYYVLENRKVYLILEEPESHLYPSAQNAVAELLGMFFNAGNHMLLTTHSPYILGAVNNLLYAGNLFIKNGTLAKEVDKVVAEKMQIDARHTSACYARDGILRNIMDEELMMIQNDVIDEITVDINSRNEKLMELDLLN